MRRPSHRQQLTFLDSAAGVNYLDGTHILAGDSFQTNIAQRFVARLSISFDSLALYFRLQSSKPVLFAALLRCGELTAASSSLEYPSSLINGKWKRGHDCAFHGP